MVIGDDVNHGVGDTATAPTCVDNDLREAVSAKSFTPSCPWRLKAAPEGPPSTWETTRVSGTKKAFFAYTVSFFPRVGRFTSKQAEVFYLVSGNG